MGAPKVHICKIETKKHKANAFLAYFSAFLTFALVVCLIVSALTLFEFSGHFWRGGLLLCIFLLFLFSAWFQWEVNPTLQTNEKGQVVYSYQETIKAMGNNTITYEFIRVDKIKYKAEKVVLHGLFEYKQPLRKKKQVKTCKINYNSEEIEAFLTKYCDC